VLLLPVLFGLLAMHVLSAPGAGRPVPTAPQATAIEPVAERHQRSLDDRVGVPAFEAAPQCPACPGDEDASAAACGSALLLGLMLGAPTRGRRLEPLAARRSGRAPSAGARGRRAAIRVLLCISRT